jgi:hypothetical protein
MYIRQYLLEDNTEKQTYSVIDDKNIPAPTLAKRRLIMANQGVRLKPLGTAVFFLGDFIKIAIPTMWFIDSSGQVFRYKKSTKAKLTFRKIVFKHNIPTGGAILQVEGISSRFKCLFAPRPDEQYAGILHMGLSYILYGVYDTKYDSTWRMV